MLMVENHYQLAVAAPDDGSSISSWKVSAKRGTQSGVGVSVSGAGAWAELVGDMEFQIQHMDSSSTYDAMKNEYNISGGVSGFWGWIGIGANASTHKEEIHQVFKQVADSQQVAGHAHFNLIVGGIYPNVQVNASAYVLILQIEDSSGNTYQMFSTGNPTGDTGAQDQNGNSLPNKDNNSSVTI